MMQQRICIHLCGVDYGAAQVLLGKKGLYMVPLLLQRMRFFTSFVYRRV